MSAALRCPREHPRAKYTMFWRNSQRWDVSGEEPAGGLWALGDRCQDAVPGEMGWSQARSIRGCVGQCFWRKEDGGPADLPLSVALVS